jgi:hypothetical protein
VASASAEHGYLLGLATEGRERAAPGGDVRIIGRPRQLACAEVLLGRVEQRRGAFVAGTVGDALDEQDQRDVLGVGGEDVGIDGG